MISGIQHSFTHCHESTGCEVSSHSRLTSWKGTAGLRVFFCGALSILESRLYEFEVNSFLIFAAGGPIGGRAGVQRLTAKSVCDVVKDYAGRLGLKAAD